MFKRFLVVQNLKIANTSFEPDVVLYLSYHSYTEAVLLACLSLGRATTTGRMLHSRRRAKQFAEGGHNESAQMFNPIFFKIYLIILKFSSFI